MKMFCNRLIADKPLSRSSELQNIEMDNEGYNDLRVSLFERISVIVLMHLACMLEAFSMALLAALVLVPKAYQMRGYWAIGGEWVGVIIVFSLTYYIRFQILRSWRDESGKHK